MSYAVKILPEAIKDLAKLPGPVVSYVALQIERLAANPTELSGPSHFPYPETGQAFKFEYHFGREHFYFHVLFQYGQDEQTIYILLIGVMRI